MNNYDYGVIFDRKMAEETARDAMLEVSGSLERLYDDDGSIFDSARTRALVTDDELRAIISACRAFEVALAPLIEDIEARAEAGKNAS